LYRPCPEAEIIKCDYDYDAETLGELRFKSPIPYVHEHVVSSATPYLHKFYEQLRKNPSALGVYLANGAFLMVIYKDTIVGVSVLQKYEDRAYSVKVDMPKRSLLKIGFAKTRPETKEIAIPPYRLFYDLLTNTAFLHMKWVWLEEKPIQSTNIGLYKELLQTGHEAIYTNKLDERRFI
jgi:hypothetical protein